MPKRVALLGGLVVAIALALFSTSGRAPGVDLPPTPVATSADDDRGGPPPAEGGEPPVLPPGRQAPTLVSLTDTDTGCRWETHTVPDGERTVAVRSGACPDDVLWLDSSTQVDLVYERDRNLFRVAGDGEETPVALPRNSGEWLVDFWVDAETRRLRIAYMVEIECALSGERCTYDLGERRIESVRPEGGWERFAIVDGFSVTATDQDALWRLPTWGSRMVALMYEEAANGGWSLVAGVPTRAEAGDTPGIGVLQIEKAPDALSFSDLLSAGSCMGHLLAGTGCDEGVGDPPAVFADQLVGLDFEMRSVRGPTPSGIFPRRGATHRTSSPLSSSHVATDATRRHSRSPKRCVAP